MIVVYFNSWGLVEQVGGCLFYVIIMWFEIEYMEERKGKKRRKEIMQGATQRNLAYEQQSLCLSYTNS